MNLPTTSAEVQSAVAAGLVTWPEVMHVLRDDLHMPDGAIDEWRKGDREIGAILVGWISRAAATADRAARGNAD